MERLSSLRSRLRHARRPSNVGPAIHAGDRERCKRGRRTERSRIHRESRDDRRRSATRLCVRRCHPCSTPHRGRHVRVSSASSTASQRVGVAKHRGPSRMECSSSSIRGSSGSPSARRSRSRSPIHSASSTLRSTARMTLAVGANELHQIRVCCTFASRLRIG